MLLALAFGSVTALEYGEEQESNERDAYDSHERQRQTILRLRCAFAHWGNRLGNHTALGIDSEQRINSGDGIVSQLIGHKLNISSGWIFIGSELRKTHSQR